MAEYVCMSRYLLFALAILVGLGLGLFYGWVVSPVEFVDTTPDSLRIDYRADYVLMVAEAYAHEDDLVAAVRRLASLGAEPPDEIVEGALLFSREQGYTAADLALMEELADALQTWNPALEQSSP